MSDVLTEKTGHIFWVTLNRPESSNAYSIEMVEELVRVLKEADKDTGIRVIVLTGAGKHFCAGGDIKAMRDKTGMFAGKSNDLKESYQYGIQQIPLTISQLKTPIIAMVNGAAIGAGCDLAAMCDLRVASEEAVFAETFAQVGLVPGDGGAYFLTRLIGFGRAMEMFLTCKKISASQALEIGLVTQVVLPEKLKDKTRELAEHLASLPPIALQMTKKALVHGYHNDLSSHLELMSAYQGITQRSSDHFRALDAMLEKRSPEYNHD